MDIILGITAVVLGLVLVFAGLRVFFAALPILGFLAGFFAGGAAVQAIAGDGFLSTFTSWIVGFIVGIVIGAIATFWWYAGALIAAGSFGAIVGTGLFQAFGINSNWILIPFGIIGFALFFIAALIFALPIYVVVVNSSFAGATVVIVGILLIFDQVRHVDLGYGTAIAIIDASWWWTIPWVALSVIGVMGQMAAIASATFALPEEKWAPVWEVRR